MITISHFGNAQHLKGTSHVTAQQIYDALLAQKNLSENATKSAIEQAAFLGWLPMIEYVRICATIDQGWMYVEFREPVHRRTIEIRNAEINAAIQALHAEMLSR